jgi:hypothetical protein
MTTGTDFSAVGAARGSFDAEAIRRGGLIDLPGPVPGADYEDGGA